MEYNPIKQYEYYYYISRFITSFLSQLWSNPTTHLRSQFVGDSITFSVGKAAQ